MNTITIDRATAQQALEALEGWDNYGKWVWPESALEQAKRNTTEAVTALRAVLAQQAEPVEPVEPVAWRYKYSDGFWRFSNGKRVNGCDPIESQALYTEPPQRKPLTEEEMLGIIDAELEGGSLLDVARAVERAHGIPKP